MLNTKSFLTVDFGAGSLKLAEFEVNEAGSLSLKQFGIRPLGPEGAQESTREGVMLKALQELLVEKSIKAKKVNVCAPGFHVFSKFVKLPPVDAAKVTQIIQYEAQQNVPFPLEEVVWDYQILGSTPGGELEVLLVAIKAEIVEGLFRVAEKAGLKLQLADVSPAALCNAFRYNYGDLEDCTILLDIGAKTSNLLFFEKGKVFSRSINVGANTITQDFANESKLPVAQAEQLKISEGFVSLGGAYEEPESAHQAAISKIARQFMTRLHIQLNQTLQFYRGQQGGSAPRRLFLSGGASIMPYTAQFFAEKLNVPVEYFNPFRNVQIDPAINLEELVRVAHSLGEVVGLGLRNLAHCPVELNLMSESTRRWQSFNQKKPYFMTTVFSLTLVVFATSWLFEKLAKVKVLELEEKVLPLVNPLKKRESEFKQAYHVELKKLLQEDGQMAGWMEDRYYWADVLTELRQVLIRTEEKTRKAVNRDAGVWIERFIVDASSGGAAAGVPTSAELQANPELARQYAARYGTAVPAPGAPAGAPPATPAQPAQNTTGDYGDYGTREAPAAPTEPPAPGPAQPAAGPASTPAPDAANEGATVTLVCRAVSLSSAVASGNTDLAFAFLSELKTSKMVDPERTAFSGNIGADEPPGTFTFSVTVKLKPPRKL